LTNPIQIFANYAPASTKKDNGINLPNKSYQHKTGYLTSRSVAQAENIDLNITQRFGFHLIQILQHSLDERKYKILRQFPNPVVKGLISVFEVQLHIPPVFPQSQQVDGSSPSNAPSHPAAPGAILSSIERVVTPIL
jgi:hypothetical protein